jgi:hypothetical protein
VRVLVAIGCGGERIALACCAIPVKRSQGIGVGWRMLRGVGFEGLLALAMLGLSGIDASLPDRVPDGATLKCSLVAPCRLDRREDGGRVGASLASKAIHGSRANG